MGESAKPGYPVFCADIGPFGAAGTRAYAEASGDSNAIHLDQETATSAGFAGPIVQGMLILGHLIRLAEEWSSEVDVNDVRTRFVKTVGIDEVLHVEGRTVYQNDTPSPNSPILRMIAKNDNGVIAVIADVIFAASRSNQE